MECYIDGFNLWWDKIKRTLVPLNYSIGYNECFSYRLEKKHPNRSHESYARSPSVFPVNQGRDDESSTKVQLSGWRKTGTIRRFVEETPKMRLQACKIERGRYKTTSRRGKNGTLCWSRLGLGVDLSEAKHGGFRFCLLLDR